MLYLIVNMRQVVITLLILLLGSSTSGQQYPNCGNCQRDDLSDYFVWDLRSDRNVSVVFRFDQPVYLRRISMWFWNAPLSGIVVPNLTLYSSSDNSTTLSNQISIDTSDSPVPVENRQYRLNVDIINEGLMVQSLRIMMTISEGTHTFLSELLFCVSTTITTTITSTGTATAIMSSTKFTTSIAASPTTTLSTTGVMPNATMGTDSSLTVFATDAVVTTTTMSNPSTDVSSTVAGGSGGGGNVGAIVAPIIVILILMIVIIVIIILFLVWKRRNQKKFNVGNHSESYYSSVQDAKLRSLTVNSDTLETRFGGTLNGNSAQSNVPVYSVPERKNSRKDASTSEKPKAVEKSQSLVSIQSSLPAIPHRTSAYNETANEVENPFYDQAPVDHLAVTGETEVDNYSMDDEVLDDSFDEEDGPTPVHKGKKGRSPRRGKSKSPSKTPTRKPKQQSTSSSTPSNVLSPLKSTSSQTSSLQSSMQPNPLYASSQSLDNIELNIYDSIKNPKYSTSSDVGFAESIYSEISEPDTLITTEDPKIDSVKVAKDLYPYSSIYAEPLPLDKSESPPLVTVDNIKEVKQLGTGQFGEVVLAKTAGLSEYYLQLSPREDCSVSLQVAVKKLKLDSTKEMQTSFEKEIKFMSRLKDDNVIRLLGICTSGTPFIMMEYMENGDLNQYLQQFDLLLDPDKVPSPTQITPITLTYIAYQIASGMKYLSSLKYVHRDLATRNVLVGKDYVVKIADFGMSQNLYSAYYFKVKGRAILPIRWMAYECFFGKFSVKTDVWAFGITLWEIFTIAKQQPYHEMGDQQVIDSALKGEKRILMAKPDNCPDEIYEVMLSCWVHDPSKRANFADLFDALKEITNRQ
ncbi:class II receptor tyrosine kinase-like isoform X3 [Dysidea avara]|uniref:class II receptor tyrosine kinase-like isoform X3 n=1 Tax=Dysidea avara TaxID=196820 RepID=UPI00332868D3